MSLSDAETMRASIVTVIGRDNVYITANEDVRRFDPISVVSLYAGQLLFGFVRSAGVWLWQAVKEKAAETGKKAIGDAFNAALTKVENTVSPTAETAASTSQQTQAQQLDLANQALKELGTTIEPAYIENFLAAGEAAAAKQLIKDNFPPAKAHRIAAAITLQVELKLKGAQPA